MRIQALLRELKYRGEVEGKRQTYYVFEGSDFFLILSFSRTKSNAGNFNIVRSRAVDYVHSRFSGANGVTVRDVLERSKRTPHVPDAFAALNILYVLTATGNARVDTRRADARLFFNVRRRA